MSFRPKIIKRSAQDLTINEAYHNISMFMEEKEIAMNTAFLAGVQSDNTEDMVEKLKAVVAELKRVVELEPKTKVVSISTPKATSANLQSKDLKVEDLNNLKDSSRSKNMSILVNLSNSTDDKDKDKDKDNKEDKSNKVKKDKKKDKKEDKKRKEKDMESNDTPASEEKMKKKKRRKDEKS